jgi:hypothetical protein
MGIWFSILAKWWKVSTLNNDREQFILKKVTLTYENLEKISHTGGENRMTLIDSVLDRWQ